MNGRTPALFAAVGLVLAACSDGATTSPTTGAPAATTVVATSTPATTVAESTTTTISPDAQQILFLSDLGQAGVYQLWLMNADGSDAHAITNAPYSHFSPAWSPDGTKIAFQADGPDHHGIYVINADGTGEVQLTTRAYDQSPEWSPDGTKIVYAAEGGGAVPYFIYTINADGSNPVRLTANPDDEYAPTADYSTFEIWLMNADGSDQKAITVNGADDGVPVWVP